MIDKTKNLCDECGNKNNFPNCMPNDVVFGNGKGNDNIIECNNHIKGGKK